MTATGPEGTAWSCVRGGAAGGQGVVLCQRVVGMELPRAVGTALSAGVEGVLGQQSQIEGLDFGVLCGAKSWNQRSLWFLLTWDIL